MITFTSPNDENNFINLEYDYSESDVEKVKKLIAIVWDKIINLDLPSVEHYPSSIKGIKAFEDDLLNGNI